VLFAAVVDPTAIGERLGPERSEVSWFRTRIVALIAGPEGCGASTAPSLSWPGDGLCLPPSSSSGRGNEDERRSVQVPCPLLCIQSVDRQPTGEEVAQSATTGIDLVCWPVRVAVNNTGPSLPDGR